ncbi:MAG: hypothetical protein O9322_05810 [Beijerinckiaceae bacterium]|nr:hypothetical protein [Beijerinckiaceae bacterium]MCZ8299038.1 hypothetical protein [Beijerinckiaceae bacterium]
MNPPPEHRHEWAFRLLLLALTLLWLLLPSARAYALVAQVLA